MAGEAPKSEILPQNDEQSSVEATIESNAHGGAESSCNNINAGTSGVTSDHHKSLEYADELIERGSTASKEGDYSEATECYSRALEIRAAHYGELAPECITLYYKYGCALLYKAQEEADPLGAVPKKEGETQQGPDRNGTITTSVIGESSSASGPSSAAEPDGSSDPGEGDPDDASCKKGKEQDNEESDDDEDESAEADEDDSDLDLAWKMLDLARAIAERDSGDTMEKADILSALAEVALEREDIETSVGDYLKALAILERLVEPDSRLIAELNFRICLCLETGSKAEEAIPYCQKAISICKSRVQRLESELKILSESTAKSPTSDSEQTVQHSSSGPQSNDSTADKESEIETLTDLTGDLEKKLEDLQQLVSNPTSILSDILGLMSAKAREQNGPPISSSSQIGVGSSTNGGAAGVTNLGVVGRGVKRVAMNSVAAESSPAKKPELGPTLDKGDGNAS